MQHKALDGLAALPNPNKIKGIGVLCSGDSPGMNAALRAVVRSTIAAGSKLSGIQRHAAPEEPRFES